MNKAILISLAAVVVLIVIIALAALRFLRADDADPFDEAPDEPRRQPGRAHDETRVRTAEPAVAGARRSAGRPAAAEDAAWTGGRSDRGDRAERADRTERPVRADRSDRPGRDSGFRERSTQDRPAEPDRRAGHGSSRPQPVPAAARAAKPARSGRAAANASDGPNWDSMSDVDYWTELAADKPFAPEPAPSPVSAAGSRRSPEQATGARSAARAEPRADQGGALPSRQSRSARAAAAAGRAAEFAPAPTDSRPAHAPGRYAAEPATESIAALARLASQGPAAQPSGGQPRNSQPHSTAQRAAAGQRPAPQRELLQRDNPQRPAQPRGPQPAAQPHLSGPRQQVRPLPPAPLDDDPLTSPSFPAINTSDSRSYRTTGRADTPPGGSRSIPAYSEPTQQFTAYPDVPARSSSAPSGYPVQPATPTGNPYGSFVSQPAASTPQPPAPVQDPGYAAYNHPPAPAASADSWYGAPVPGSAPVPPARHQVPGDYVPGVPPAGGYDQAAYPAQPETTAYQQAGYVPGASYEQGGYGAQDAAYGREAYQGYPGYGTGGY